MILHTSRQAKKWLSENKIKVLEWPGQFSEPKSIKHLLEHQLLKYDTPPKMCTSYGVDWWKSEIKYLHMCAKTF